MELNTNPAPDPYVEAMREWRPIITNGVIPQPKGPPLNQWREVCRWDVGPSGDGHLPERDGQDGERGDMAIQFGANYLRAVNDTIELRSAFDSLIACYEELAGEHRALLECEREVVEQMISGQLVRVPPVDAVPGYAFVRSHWRPKPRRSKLAAIDPDQGTVQAAPGEGQTGASGEVTSHVEWGDGTGDFGQVVPLIVADPIPQSGEERSE